MNKYIETITNKLTPLIEAIKRYHITIFIVGFVGVYMFLVVQINNLTNSEPDPAALATRLQTIKPLHIDQDSINRILKLEGQNIQVQALFEKARNNPFNE